MNGTPSWVKSGIGILCVNHPEQYQKRRKKILYLFRILPLARYPFAGTGSSHIGSNLRAFRVHRYTRTAWSTLHSTQHVLD